MSLLIRWAKQKNKVSYTVEQMNEERESFGPYRYTISKDNKEIAIFSHDYRGEVAGIKVISTGHEVDPPFGMSSDFLTGGGRFPLGLSSKAIDYLDQLLQKNQKAHQGGI
ncbi:hypothetical protein [Coraliomargarita parva]|uniref:hypothetical protein n=1 Tax=Coraliomargarita parva TaxID=3014050 RepID=UPI0022B40247|nr:hypothetical protein [Coraliomargarita parva]